MYRETEIFWKAENPREATAAVADVIRSHIGEAASDSISRVRESEDAKNTPRVLEVRDCCTQVLLPLYYSAHYLHWSWWVWKTRVCTVWVTRAPQEGLLVSGLSVQMLECGIPPGFLVSSHSPKHAAVCVCVTWCPIQNLNVRFQVTQMI